MNTRILTRGGMGHPIVRSDPQGDESPPKRLSPEQAEEMSSGIPGDSKNDYERPVPGELDDMA